MISALLPVLLALVASRDADPCAPVEALAADRAAAAEYQAVAEAELARGDRDTAAAAFRAAAARDPADAASRAALARLCAQSRADPFAEGVRRMEAGDLRGAIAAFRELRGDPSAALLEGICHHDLGDDEAAVPLLRLAEASPAHRELARLYLGLAALRAGAARQAASLFDSASASPSIARISSDLARLARREGRLVVSIVAESAWDSNVNLAPSSAPSGTTDSDGYGGLFASVLLRPLGARGPYLRASGDLRQQVSIDAYDFGAFDAAAGLQARLGRLSVLGEYDYGERTLGGEFLLSAHRLLASGALQRRGTVVSVTYSVRIEDYANAWEAFSGTLHRAEAKVSFPVADRARLALVYGAGRDLTDEPITSFLEHGPRAELRLALGSRARLGVEAAATFREYDGYDPLLGATERDTAYDAVALAEVDLAPRLVLRASFAARHVTSNVAALAYDRFVPAIGVSWTAGIW